MSENLELWDKVSRPPKEYLKQIKGGRLQGMTDINPQWRLKTMTENFGRCGDRWTYAIDKIWNEAIGDEILCFAMVTLIIGESRIPGIGGSKLLSKEREGLRASDEGYKMAVTDALSVAMKALGVGAEVYFGNYDGSKYRDENYKLPEKSDPAPGGAKPWQTKSQRDMGTFVGFVNAVEEKTGTNAKGAWTLFKIATENAVLITFDKAIAAHCRQAMTWKTKVEFVTQPSKYGSELLSVHGMKEKA